MPRTARLFALATVSFLLLVTGACVYQVDVQQGNKLEPQDVEAVQVGMTRNQVRFLLGTPVVADPFRDDRWDYVYYFKRGGRTTPDRRWLIVWFDDNLVSKIDRDIESRPPADIVIEETAEGDEVDDAEVDEIWELEPS